jgi:hypothetical protein
VHLLSFLRQHGCPLRVTALSAAASANRVPALRWLHEHSPASHLQSACLAAAEHGSIEAMAYMLPHLEPGSLLESKPARVLSNMLNIAGCNGHLDAAKWLRQQGAAWPSILRVVFTEWSGPALVWAREEGCTSPVHLFDNPFDDDPFGLAQFAQHQQQQQ